MFRRPPRSTPFPYTTLFRSNEHRLVVTVPVEAREPPFRRPGERDRWRARLGPGPVHSPVDLLGQRSDLDLLRIIAVEVRLAKEHPGEQQRGVDGGDLALIGARAAAHVDEVIEEPVLIRFAGEEAQGREHALARRLPRDIAAFDADGVGGEPEADRGNAGERGRRKAVGNEAIPGITGLPEEAERALLEVREERIQGHGTRDSRNRVAMTRRKSWRRSRR